MINRNTVLAPDARHRLHRAMIELSDLSEALAQAADLLRHGAHDGPSPLLTVRHALVSLSADAERVSTDLDNMLARNPEGGAPSSICADRQQPSTRTKSPPLPT